MGWMTIHHILSIYIHIHPYTDTIPKNNLIDPNTHQCSSRDMTSDPAGLIP